MSRTRRTRRPPSLRWRIVAAVALLLVATNVVVGAVTVVAYRGYLVGRLDAELATAADRTLGGGPGGAPGTHPTPSGTGSPSPTAPARAGDSGEPDPDNAVIGAPGQSAGTVVAVITPGSSTLAGYVDSRGRQHRLTTAQERTLRAVDDDGRPTTVDLGTLGAYRVQSIGSHGAVFVTALPLGDLTASITRLLAVIAAVALVGAALAVASGAVLVRRALRPLDHVAGVATTVTALDLERGAPEIPVRVSDRDLAANREVGQVGTALNRLLHHVGRALAVRTDAERTMRTFIADASHELRTPIAVIRAYAELVRRSDDPEQGRSGVDRIEHEAVRMGDLVEELLLLARLDAASMADAGSAGVTRAAVDLTAFVVEDTMDARAAAPDHRWVLQVADEPVVVRGDGPQLRRLVRNLLANARTHTPSGTTVVVSVQTVDTDRTSPTARLVVANDGPPIDQDLRARLFERFTRGESSRTRESGTSGLGLAIVAAVADAHGGSVRVVSGAGRTAFTVDLPVAD